MHEYDNRYLWMNLKRIIGSHFANYREAWEANRLIQKGLSTRLFPAAIRWRTPDRRPSMSIGICIRAKSGVLCLAPDEGLGRA